MKSKHIYIVGSDNLGRALKHPRNPTGALGLISAIRLRNHMNKIAPYDTFRIIEVTNPPAFSNYDFGKKKNKISVE